MTCSKFERCSSLPTFNRKNELLEKSDDFKVKSQAKSAVKVVANEMYSANCRMKYTYEGGRKSD